MQAARKAAGLPVGRPKGSVNKLTATVRQGVLKAYRACGGDAGFARWAKEHPTEFYAMLLRAIPREREEGSGGGGVTVNIATFAEPTHARKPVIEVRSADKLLPTAAPKPGDAE